MHPSISKINNGTNGIKRLISVTRLIKKGTTSRTPATLTITLIGFLKAGLLTDNITPTKRITTGIVKTNKPIGKTAITCVDEDEVMVGTGAFIASDMFSWSTHNIS